MSVTSHLGIRLDEYDARIRTFIPDYEEMLDVAAAALPRATKVLVDLGTGTGALAARCAAVARGARLVAIDADADILGVAATRLDSRATFVAENFLRAALPRCDAVVASFSLHHVRTRAAKARLYRRIKSALARDGVLISVDCHPSRDDAIARRQRAAWLAYLERSYSPRQAAGFLRAWAREDAYVPLDAELGLLQANGLRPEVLWRRQAFAVVCARR
jgi:SAM-dependent methyltransferase